MVGWFIFICAALVVLALDWYWFFGKDISREEELLSQHLRELSLSAYRHFDTSSWGDTKVINFAEEKMGPSAIKVDFDRHVIRAYFEPVRCNPLIAHTEPKTETILFEEFTGFRVYSGQGRGIISDDLPGVYLLPFSKTSYLMGSGDQKKYMESEYYELDLHLCTTRPIDEPLIHFPITSLAFTRTDHQSMKAILTELKETLDRALAESKAIRNRAE